MQIREILIIKNAKKYYGISTQNIKQISKVPFLMNLPLKPMGTRGLCSVGGSIVNMLDFNLLLDMPEVDINSSSSRLVNLKGSLSSNALLVSEIYNTLEIDELNIEYLDNSSSPVIAIYRHRNYLIQIVSLSTLVSNICRVEIESKKIKNIKVKLHTVQEENYTKFLIFLMQNEKFALNIDFLKEIISSEFSYTDIVGNSDDFLGLIPLREELIAVIDLRSYYGFKSARDKKNRILIISYNNENIGLLVDAIIDIKSVLDKDIEYMEDYFEDNKISGVIHGAESLISFFDEEVLKKIFSKNRSYLDLKFKVEIEKKDDTLVVKELIIFKLSGVEYAFDIDIVVEIMDIVNITEVAYSDESVDGIINIRDQIITIVSLSKKLGISTKSDKGSKIIVCNINGDIIGFVVDSISDIIGVTANEIKAQGDNIISHIFQLNNSKRLISFIDTQKIVFNEDWYK